ncbi:hypothetical protein Lal_00049393 [Lupinus albus]|nr:hypothetical protein Lal_00049393 [Lupinus albus]
MANQEVNKSEVAELREQMTEMMNMILVMQEMKASTDSNTTSHMRQQTTKTYKRSNIHIHNATEKEKEDMNKWRGVASQVLPSLEEDEQLAIFINTLQNPYFDRMIGNVTPDFNALIKVGNRIEHSLKSGKIAGDQLSANEGKSLSNMIREEWETNFLADGRNYEKPKHRHQNPYSEASYPYQTSYPYTAFPYHILSQFPKHSPNTNQIHVPQQTQNNYQSINTNYTQRNPYFDPIPISYAELFDQLQNQGMLNPMEGKVFEPPYPKWYDPSASCAYHYDIEGH